MTGRPHSPGLGSRYWRLWTASAISNLGDGVSIAALPLLAASLTRDPRLVAGMAVAAGLPWLLFALPAGAIVDRLDRRKVMYRVNLARAVLVGTIAFTAGTDTAEIWLLWVIAFGLGICETLFDNAAQSILPSIVRSDQLEVANGRQYSAEMVANTFVGPPLGGLLFSVAVALPFLVDSGSFVLSALLIATLAGSFRPVPSGTGVQEKRSLRADIAEGIRWLSHHRLLRTLAIVLGILNFASNLGYATFVLFALENLGLDDRGFGFLLAFSALGSVLGGLVAGRIARRLGSGRALVVSIAAMGAAETSIGLMSSPVPVAVLSWISGLFIVVWNVITVSLRQSIIPNHLLGRVNSVYRFLGWGSIPLGALAGGWIADRWGLRAPWIVIGVIVAITLVIVAPRLTNRAIEEAREAAARDPEGQPATPLTPAPPSIT